MNLRWVGIALLWIGFFAGSFFAVCQTEIKGNAWMTIPWLYYGLSAVVCGVGIVLIRSQEKAEAGQSEETENKMGLLWERLNQLSDEVGSLKKSAPKANPHEISDTIEQRCNPLYNDFADHREGLTRRFGLDEFADIMTAFASAERYTNRAWSASADGYRDEAVASLETAHSFLDQAIERFKQASVEHKYALK